MTSEWLNPNQYIGYELQVKCKCKFSLFPSIYILTNATLQTLQVNYWKMLLYN